MKTQQLGIEETSKQRDQSRNRGTFCLNLNALRAFACISVICTHSIEYYGLKGEFLSLVYGGHMAVYFFFALSGYLLSCSLVKEVRRHLNLDKSEDKAQNHVDLSLQIERDEGEEIESQDSAKEERLEWSDRLRLELYQLITFVKREKQPLLFSVLGKYLWNRTLRLFPLYYGCWCLLKFFARENTNVGSLKAGNLWKDILLLKIFPGHLWTMRIEMMFYYYVIPLFIVGLCIVFTLEKKRFQLASKVCFFSIACILLLIALDKMNLKEDIKHPVKVYDNFLSNLPPFCFGMLAAMINFALEQEFNSKDKTQMKEDKPEGLLSSLFKKYKWNIVCVAVFLRIMMLNPGVSQTFFTVSKEIPKWQMANLNSFWYAIFILINDTRGGFWKLMHSKSKPQSSASELSFLSKVIYYVGLWSYPIYLTHPITYVTLYHYFKMTKISLDLNVFIILCCIAVGGLAHFVFDKILVNKLIMGKCLRFERIEKTLNQQKFEC